MLTYTSHPRGHTCFAKQDSFFTDKEQSEDVEEEESEDEESNCKAAEVVNEKVEAAPSAPKDGTNGAVKEDGKNVPDAKQSSDKTEPADGEGQPGDKPRKSITHFQALSLLRKFLFAPGFKANKASDDSETATQVWSPTHLVAWLFHVILHSKKSIIWVKSFALKKSQSLP